MKVKIIKIGQVEFKVNIKVNIKDGQISTISTDSVESLTNNNVNTIKAIMGGV